MRNAAPAGVKAAFSFSPEVGNSGRAAHIRAAGCVHMAPSRYSFFFIYINPIKSAPHSPFCSSKSVSSGFSLGRRLSGHIPNRINVETNSGCPALPLYPVLFNSIYARNDNTRGGGISRAGVV